MPQVLGDGSLYFGFVLMGPASEQADTGQVVDVARPTVTDPAVPEDHIPGAGGERAGRMGRGVGENAPAPFLKGLRLTEGAFDLIGVFEKIPVGGVVAARPVDKGTTPPLPRRTGRWWRPPSAPPGSRRRDSRRCGPSPV